MNQIISRAKRLIRSVQRMGRRKKIIFLLVLIGIFVIVALRSGEDVEEAVVNDTPSVALISVAESSTNSSPLSVTGKIRSKTEAQLRTEKQGEVTGVYTTVGSFIKAGKVIAELRNASERAAVTQASASLEAANANLAKATGGARDEDKTILEVNLENAENALDGARVSALNALKSGYAAIDDALSAKTDPLFSNPDSANPIFRPATSDSQIVANIVQARVELQEVLLRQKSMQNSLTTESELGDEISMLQAELILVQSYLDNVISALNNGIPTPSIDESALETFKTSAAVGRSGVSGSLSSLTAALTALNGSGASVEIAKKNLERGITGAQEEDVIALEAVVRQAEAGLAQARASLARTLIITPISGTVNTLSIREGDFVNAFAPAATVSNNNALEVTTYVTASDKDAIRSGSGALIDGQYEGVVISVAPGLDPSTKKIEVRVGIVETDTALTNGSSVRIDLQRNGFKIEADEVTEIIIPISALKIETTRTIVFTVDGDSKLVAHEVTTGLVLGDNLHIEEGLTADMSIVSDARGLREGQAVVLVGKN